MLPDECCCYYFRRHPRECDNEDPACNDLPKHHCHFCGGALSRSQQADVVARKMGVYQEKE